ncbi:MAG: carboxypeptidase-like regulatory domain-containing protein [Bacteroidales bacterium]|jgi:hypothetical protein|nr:carboxypeptidase-like regulatory domain-containing protein [Bacteroidales bacterium]
MRTFTITLILIILFFGSNAQEKAKLYGQVTDFEGNPIDSVSVRLKNKQFENVYETLTDGDGKFSLIADIGNYYCLYAIKLSDYKKTKLEYWAWNVPLFNDLEINPQYNNMELYGINAFEPQVTPHMTYRIYFRPMSLKKGNPNAIEKGDTINMAPETISPDELDIKINGADAEIVVINKTTEYARGNYYYGYDLQVLKPNYGLETIKDSERVKGFDKISIILKSKETGEIGKGEAFVKKIEK